MKLFRLDNGDWSAICDGTNRDLMDVGNALCALAHEGFGKVKVGPDGEQKNFVLIYNNTPIEFATNRELWMFAHGLRCSATSATTSTILSGTDFGFMKSKKADGKLSN